MKFVRQQESDKYEVVMFSGLDRTGKTTVRKRFAEQTNQRYITFDRSFIDNFVFDSIFRTPPLLTERTKVINRFFAIDPIIVFFDLNVKEIIKRARETENIEYRADELKKIYKSFLIYLKMIEERGFRVIYINCNHKTVEQVTNEVVKKVKKEIQNG